MSTQSTLDTFVYDVNLAHQIIHGDASTVVMTDGGPVRSFAKVEADNEAAISDILSGSLGDAGTIDGNSQILISTPSGARQSILSTLAQWIIGSFIGITQTGSGATPLTLQSALRVPFNVKQFGVAADDLTDDTVALQRAFDAAVAAKRGLDLGDGVIRITAPITIGVDDTSVVTGLCFSGRSRGGSTIKQMTDNVPIFKIHGHFVHTLVFERMTLMHANMQTGNTLAAVFRIDGPSDGSIYNCVFQDIGGSNFYWFMDCQTVTWWGMTYRDMWLGDFAGGVNYITTNAGEPNCRFERLYITCQSAVEVLFRHDAMTAQYDNIEVNSADSGAAMLYDVSGGTHVIGHWALEGATYATDTTLFNVQNGVLIAKFIYTETLSIPAGKTVTAFHCEGTRSYINVEFFSIKGFGTLVGNFIAVLSPGTRYARFKQILMPFASNVMLTDMGGAASADFTVVEDWNDPARIEMQGDANVTLSYDSALQQVFDVALTADRTVTLPADTQLFSGRRFRFTKTNTSAHSLTVKNSGGTTIGTIAASNRGIVEVVFHRGGGSASRAWVLADQRTY
jgi:hypothetical protein